MSAFHPDLRFARFIPRIGLGPRAVKLTRRIPVRTAPAPDDVIIEDVRVPGADGAPDVSLRVYRPAGASGPVPALFWLHGGGYVIGSPLQDEGRSIATVRELGIAVAASSYRLAPEHASPAAVQDAYAALKWLFDNAESRGVDATRIAIGGASAGGGLAASLVLYAHDKGEVQPVFQLLIYPMLDDRTVLRKDMDTRNARIWTPEANRYGWTSYLGRPPGGPGVSPYAAPSRRENLRDLPPAWIGVGTLDLFHDEDVAYAASLTEAGVPCELFIIPGAFHGFDALFPKTGVAGEFLAEQLRALREPLGLAAR